MAGADDSARAGIFVASAASAAPGHVDEPALMQVAQLRHENFERVARELVCAWAKDALTALDALQDLGVTLIHGQKITVGRVSRDETPELIPVFRPCARPKCRQPGERVGHVTGSMGQSLERGVAEYPIFGNTCSPCRRAAPRGQSQMPGPDWR